MTILTTSRLTLRPLTHDDVDALLYFANDSEVRRYLFSNQVMTKELIVKLIDSSVETFETHGFGYFALEIAETGAWAGFCGFREFEAADDNVAELRYGILPQYWGEGFVSEAVPAILEFVFSECGVDRIVAVMDTPNQRSVRVMQRLGMAFEERREWHGLDSVFYAMTAAEFADR